MKSTYTSLFCLQLTSDYGLIITVIKDRSPVIIVDIVDILFAIGLDMVTRTIFTQE